MRPPVASTRLAALDLGRLTGAARAAAAALDRRYRLVLAALLGLQWLGALWIALAAEHDGWLYHHGGDGTWYWTAAWELGHFRLPYTAIGYGYSTLLAPFGAVFGPSMLAGLPAAILLNTLVLLPLALWLTYAVAERIAGRLFGLFAATLWVVVPLLAYRGFRAGDAQPEFLNIFLPGSIGLNMLGDFPSLVACLGAAYFALRALDSRAPADTVLCGLLAGFAIGIKPANALFLPAPLLAFAVARRGRDLLPFAAGLALPLLALAVWKSRGLGDLPLLRSSLPELRLAAGSRPVVGALGGVGGLGGDHVAAFHEHMGELREIFWSKTLLEWAPIAGTVGLVRRAPAQGALVAAWFWAFLLVKGTSELAHPNSMTFFRLLEPAYPAFLLLVAGLVFLVPRRRPVQAPLPTRPVGRRIVLAAAACLGLLPLLLVAVARPVAAGTTARGVGSGVQVVVAPLGLDARVDGDAVRLSWSRRSSGDYRVFRAPAAQPDCQPPTGPGVHECYLTPAFSANTVVPSFLDRPGKGSWTYRVALTGSETRVPGASDPLLLSTPVTVTVR